MLPGENIDCFARRAGDPTGQQDDARQDPENRIQNTSIKVVKAADGKHFKVDEEMTLSKGPRNAKKWKINPPTGSLTINDEGKLTGSIDEGTYKVTVTVSDDEGDIDSREFTVVAAEAKKGESISLCIPYVSTNGQTPRVNSGFGPRMHPIHKVMKLHKGQDWVGGRQGKIVAAADGEVVFCGNAGAYGNQIRINHLAADGSIIVQTTYNHLSQILVTRGQKVAQGQAVGKEGSTGASTGNHLHFEVLLGGKQHVDPAPYLSGTFTVQPPAQADGTQPPPKTVDNSGGAAAPITLSETNARTASDCPQVLDSGATPVNSNSSYPQPGDDFKNQAATTSDCKPEKRPSYSEVSAMIDEALNGAAGLDAEDKKLIRFIAQIESRFDPYAKNPTSSAMGLYQMLDKIAVKYFGIIGVPPTCVNRCNAKYATQAMIEFYKRELKSYYDGYKASGGTKIANKPIKPTPHSQRYPSLSKGEFCYGLIHHDGVGSAVNGKDLQGVDYFRKKVKETGFA
jgi:murein DD-endopeptidase MepM/ murein hydrolase activator NlpD